MVSKLFKMSEENSCGMNNHMGDGEEFTIHKPDKDGVNPNKSSNHMSAEGFPIEISKVQELMHEQEELNTAEILKLEQQLVKQQEDNKGLEKMIAEVEAKESEDFEKLYEAQLAENKRLTQELDSAIEKKKSLSAILTEYQKSTSRFKSQFEMDEQQLLEQKKVLVVEKDYALRLVETMEAEFNTIHQRYEKCKTVVELLRDNEKNITDVSANCSETTRLMNFQLCHNLKEQSKDILDKSCKDMNTILKSTKTEIAKMQAILQRVNLKVESQNETVLQLSSELNETANMCDRLIGKINN